MNRRMPKRLYHFLPWDFAIESVEKKRIKVATLRNCNDLNELKGIITDHPKLNKNLADEISNFLHYWGIICFSKIYNNSLMWGHYADNNSGICLGFDVTSENLDRVFYDTKKTEIGYVYDGQEKGNLLDSLHIKSIDWLYEEEYRIRKKLSDLQWDKNNDIYFSDYGNELCLKEIILGDRAHKDIHYIYRLLEHLNVTESIKISKVKTSKSKFELELCKKNTLYYGNYNELKPENEKEYNYVKKWIDILEKEVSKNDLYFNNIKEDIIRYLKYK